MKYITRTLLAAVALSFAAMPMAQAQQHYGHDRKPGHSYTVKKKVVTTRHTWRKGERYSNWKAGRPCATITATACTGPPVASNG